jgi:uncharacterized protein (TIGR02996 family)
VKPASGPQRVVINGWVLQLQVRPDGTVEAPFQVFPERPERKGRRRRMAQHWSLSSVLRHVLPDQRPKNAFYPTRSFRVKGDAGFVGKLLETPRDRTTWTIFADWLDEQGRLPRASFIRDWLGACLDLRDCLGAPTPGVRVRDHVLSVQAAGEGLVVFGQPRRLKYTDLPGPFFRSSCGKGWDDRRFLAATGKVCDRIDEHLFWARPGEMVWEAFEVSPPPIPQSAVEQEMERTGYEGDYIDMSQEEADHWLAWLQQFKSSK